MAIDEKIELNGCDVYLREQKRDLKYSTIDYNITPINVSPPNDQDFETDISFLVEQFFCGNDFTLIKGKSEKLAFANDGSQVYEYLGKINQSPLHLTITTHRYPQDSLIKRTYNLKLQVIGYTAETSDLRKIVQSCLFPILNEYSVKIERK